MNSNNVKTHLYSHSEAKVRLLGEYLDLYLNVICNVQSVKRIKIYDLFCGEGIYQNDGEGSPIVILNKIRNIYYNNKSRHIPRIDCHFNDIKNETIEKLKQCIGDKSLHNPEIGDIDFSSHDYNFEYDNLIKNLPSFKMHNQKAFIFIDPYGYKCIKANQIKRLMELGNAEVLLWLPIQFMYRFEKNGTPDALKDFIEELVPFEDWKPSDDIWKFISQLKDCLQSHMGDNYFVDTFRIQKDSNTVFCLFFFTSHIKGFEKMLEAKWNIDTQEGMGWDYNEGQLSLFEDSKTNPLKDALKEYLLEKKRYNGEVYEFTLRQGFLTKHTNEILRSWQNHDRLDVLDANNEKVRKNSFYIQYKYYKDDNKKVSFILK